MVEPSGGANMFKIVVLGEGKFYFHKVSNLIQPVLASPPSLSNTARANSTRNKSQQSMQPLTRKKSRSMPKQK